MSTHPNVRLAHEVWDAVSRGDGAALRAALAPDIVWHATARGAPWSGEHRGPDAVVDFLVGVGEAADSFQAKLVDVLTSEDRVLVVFHATFQRRGRTAEIDYLAFARVRDGRLAEMWTVPLDAGALERFWSRPPSVV